MKISEHEIHGIWSTFGKMSGAGIFGQFFE